MKKIIVGLIILLFLCITCGAYTYKTKKVTEVQLNEEIVLEKNERIKLKDQEVYLCIKKFINSTPPEGATAIWSGLAVIYEVEIDRKKYKTNDVGILEEYESIPYIVDILDSDYKTFAKVKFIENK
ncbi:MAG: hypothetical protein J6C46_10200 [Clostridia bacterium]|nr:hypothetical protein [Clostridia bacterium]